LGLCCADNVLVVFSPSAVISFMEITGATGCLGPELGLALLGDACIGLGCLAMFSAFAFPGFAEITGVKSWLGLGLLGDEVLGLAFFGVVT